MRRDQFTRPALIALLCIVALGLSAATLTTATVGGGDGGESVLADKSSTETTSGGEADTNSDRETFEPIEADNQVLCTETDQSIPTSLLLVLLGLSIVVVFGVLLDIEWAVSLAPIGLMLVLLILVFSLIGCGGLGSGGDDTGPASAVGEVTESVSDTGPGEVTERVFSAPTYLIWLLAGTVILSLFFLLFRSGGGAEDEFMRFLRTEDRSENATTATIGRVAGDTAEEIDGNASLENAVYEAWAEMTGELDVEDPETSTPAEFAAAAREVGIEARDVDELTRLFEEVRYGTTDPTQAREQQAVEMLERIERNYTPGNRGDSSGFTAGQFADSDESG